MSDLNATRLVAILERHHDDLLAQWTADQLNGLRSGRISESDLRAQAAELLQALRRALGSGGSANPCGTSSRTR